MTSTPQPPPSTSRDELTVLAGHYSAAHADLTQRATALALANAAYKNAKTNERNAAENLWAAWQRADLASPHNYGHRERILAVIALMVPPAAKDHPALAELDSIDKERGHHATT